MAEISKEDEQRIRQRLEKRYQEWQGFAIHGVMYLLVNLFLWIFWFALNFVPSIRVAFESITPDSSLIDALSNLIIPLVISLGWGVGLAAHYVHYYLEFGPGADRHEATIQREIERYKERVAGYEKPKNDRKAHLELNDDGEIQEVYEDEASRQRRQG